MRDGRTSDARWKRGNVWERFENLRWCFRVLSYWKVQRGDALSYCKGVALGGFRRISRYITPSFTCTRLVEEIPMQLNFMLRFFTSTFCINFYVRIWMWARVQGRVRFHQLDARVHVRLGVSWSSLASHTLHSSLRFTKHGGAFASCRVSVGHLLWSRVRGRSRSVGGKQWFASVLEFAEICPAAV